MTQQVTTTEPPRPIRAVHYGRLAYPGIGYRMGKRQMATFVLSLVTYVATVRDREAWDPLSGTGTNRKVSTAAEF